MRGKADHLTQHIGVGALLQQRDNSSYTTPRDTTAGVAPDRLAERHCRQLQTPAAAPDRHAGGKCGTSEIDLPRMPR
jgi:hypothetical protein